MGVGSVCGETPDGNLDCVEKSRECGGVVPAARCEFGRHNEPLGIHPDVQLPPIPAFLCCLVLVRVPFTATQNLQPCGIDDQVDRAVVGSGQGRHRNDLVPARECGVVRGLEVEAHQAEQRVQEPLGLAERQSDAEALTVIASPGFWEYDTTRRRFEFLVDEFTEYCPVKEGGASPSDMLVVSHEELKKAGLDGEESLLDLSNTLGGDPRSLESDLQRGIKSELKWLILSLTHWCKPPEGNVDARTRINIDVGD